LKALKRDAAQVVVGAIAGLPSDYSIEMIQQMNDREPHPNIKNSCMSPTGEYADPSVRLLQWVQSFGDHGIMETICANDFRGALDRIATLVSTKLGPQCITGTLVDKDPSTSALDPECQVVGSYTDAQEQRHEKALPACAVDAKPPCWSLVDDAKCPDAKLLQVTRDGATLPDDMHTSVSCSVCIPGVPRPGCP
jgi:hypothetical protein